MGERREYRPALMKDALIPGVQALTTGFYFPFHRFLFPFSEGKSLRFASSPLTVHPSTFIIHTLAAPFQGLKQAYIILARLPCKVHAFRAPQK
jgi:hypothetical protein